MRRLIPAIVCIATLCLMALVGCNSHSVTVTFTPPALKDCGTNTVRSAIEVHWDASGVKRKGGVNLWISNKKPQRTGVFAPDKGTKWIYGATAGSHVTGDWMFPGTTITVTDAANDDDILATVRVPSAPCE